MSTVKGTNVFDTVDADEHTHGHGGEPCLTMCGVSNAVSSHYSAMIPGNSVKQTRLSAKDLGLVFREICLGASNGNDKSTKNTQRLTLMLALRRLWVDKAHDCLSKKISLYWAAFSRNPFNALSLQIGNRVLRRRSIKRC